MPLNGGDEGGEPDQQAVREAPNGLGMEPLPVEPRAIRERVSRNDELLGGRWVLWGWYVCGSRARRLLLASHPVRGPVQGLRIHDFLRVEGLHGAVVIDRKAAST